MKNLLISSTYYITNLKLLLANDSSILLKFSYLLIFSFINSNRTVHFNSNFVFLTIKLHDFDLISCIVLEYNTYPKIILQQPHITYKFSTYILSFENNTRKANF